MKHCFAPAGNSCFLIHSGSDTMQPVNEQKTLNEGNQDQQSSQRPSSNAIIDEPIHDKTSVAIRHVLSIMKTQKDTTLKIQVLERTIQRISCIEENC